MGGFSKSVENSQEGRKRYTNKTKTRPTAKYKRFNHCSIGPSDNIHELPYDCPTMYRRVVLRVFADYMETYVATKQ